MSRRVSINMHMVLYVILNNRRVLARCAALSGRLHAAAVVYVSAIYIVYNSYKFSGINYKFWFFFKSGHLLRNFISFYMYIPIVAR